MHSCLLDYPRSRPAVAVDKLAAAAVAAAQVDSVDPMNHRTVN